MPIPSIDLRPGIEETAADWRARLDQMFARGQFILGPQLAEFEKRFAAWIASPFVAGVGNGTAAIEICLRAEGITDPRHEVLTTPLTAAFTAVGIRSAGPKVRFADIDPETLQLDPESVEHHWSRATRALVGVHLYGQPCAAEALSRWARRKGALFIQDAAQAHGATLRGKPLTAYSPYVTYSFYPTKNLGALGDGGAIATALPRRAKRLLEWRDGGRRGGMVSYSEGINSRLDEMQCCYLLAFLTRIEEWNARRAKLAALYDELLAGCDGVRPVKRSAESVNHLYVILAKRREKLKEFLASRGIGTGIHYPVPLHLQPAFASPHQARGALPVAERACKEVLSLPMYPHLKPEAVEQVAAAVRSFYGFSAKR
jgi:dTDP-3-amino-3,4,6-trideoxy-alpha-D-glucose transaminase